MEQEKVLNEIATTADTHLEWAKQLIGEGVTDDQSYEFAGTILRDIKAEIKRSKDEYEHLYRPLKTAMDRLRARWKEVTQPFDEAERLLRSAMTRYTQEKEKAAREEALRLAAEARKELEAEKADEQKVVALVERAQEIQTEAPDLEGISYREHWKAEVIDIRLLCGAVAAGKAEPDLVAPNMKRLNEIARAMKTAFDVPGCEAIKDKVIQVRS